MSFDARRVETIFAHLDQGSLPGAAVGIAVHGVPVFRRGFGLANMELPVALSPAIRMRIASMSKHFTCLAYLLLCEQGKASPDDAIGTYLPELHPVARGATVRQLMGHTSGLRDVIDIGWQFGGRGQPVRSAELLDLYRHIDDVNCTPDTRWIYNNGGLLLLSAAIERIAGQSLEEVLRQRIFEPVGMYDTMLRRWDTDFVPNSAALHMTSAGGRYVRSYLGMELTGDAGVVSTVDDMLRWLAHMDSPTVGSAATWRAIKTPQTLSNATSTGYGLGLVSDRYRGAEILYHDGGVMGGNSRMLKVPALGLDIVVMVNRQDANAAVLVDQILDACVPELEPLEELPRRQAGFEGTYVSPQTGRVAHLFVRDGLQIAAVDGFDVPMIADRDKVLRPASRYRMLKLEIEAGGDARCPDSMVLIDFGSRDVLRRADADAKPGTAAIEGVYRCAAIGVQAQIDAGQRAAQLTMSSRFGAERFALEKLAANLWRAQPRNWWPPGGVLTFDSPEVGGFLFSSARTRALRFQRVGSA